MVEPVRRIVGLGNDRIEGSAEERCVHFVGDLFHPACENCKRDRVNRIAH